MFSFVLEPQMIFPTTLEVRIYLSLPSHAEYLFSHFFKIIVPKENKILFVNQASWESSLLNTRIPF